MIWLSSDFDIKARIAGHGKRFTRLAGFPVFALDLVAAGPANSFHDFRHAGIEG